VKVEKYDKVLGDSNDVKVKTDNEDDAYDDEIPK